MSRDMIYAGVGLATTPTAGESGRADITDISTAAGTVASVVARSTIVISKDLPIVVTDTHVVVTNDNLPDHPKTRVTALPGNLLVGALRSEAWHTPEAERMVTGWPIHASTGGSILMSMSQRKSRSDHESPPAQPRSEPTKWKPLIDRLSVATFLVAWSAMILRITPEIFSPDAWPTTLSALGIGYLLADLLAGSVHWIADRFFERDTPVLGPMLITPFREHHDDPLGITRHDFYEVSGNNALVTIPVVLLVAALPEAAAPLSRFFLALGAGTTLFLFMTNQFHGWAHSPSPPRAVSWLHSTGIILTPRRHARHHRGNHDQAYCVTSGWMNPILDRLGLFKRLEHLCSRFTRTMTNLTGRMT